MTQSKRKLGLGLLLPSGKHAQCQVSFENNVRTSSNSIVGEIHKSTAPVVVQYDQFSTINEGLGQARCSDQSYLIEKLRTSLMIKPIWKHVDSNFINQWSMIDNQITTNVISHFLWNIDSFTKCYLNNTLSQQYISKWNQCNHQMGHNKQLYLQVLWWATNPWSYYLWM